MIEQLPKLAYLLNSKSWGKEKCKMKADRHLCTCFFALMYTSSMRASQVRTYIFPTRRNAVKIMPRAFVSSWCDLASASSSLYLSLQ